jgi:hypothetical protein
MAKTYRFLIDNSNPHLLHHFPASQSLRDVGLDESAPDDAILSEAIARSLTIVTRNDADFIRLMRDAAKRSGFENCTGDAYGLVNPHGRRVNFDDVTRRLKYNDIRIDWTDVAHFNLKVSIGTNDPIVSTLPRCKFHVADCNDPDGCGDYQLFRRLGLDKVVYE